MNKVISLDNKLKHSAARKAAVLRKQKIQAVRRVFQCTQCASKCERCGTGVGIISRQKSEHIHIPYNFCDSCAEDYLDYISCLQSQGDPDMYWHNLEWLKVWRTWIDYQGAIDQYKNSKEFRRLIDELRSEDHPGE